MKKIKILLFLVVTAMCITACDSFEKKDYSGVLLPIVTVVPYGTDVSENADAQTGNPEKPDIQSETETETPKATEAPIPSQIPEITDIPVTDLSETDREVLSSDIPENSDGTVSADDSKNLTEEELIGESSDNPDITGIPDIIPEDAKYDINGEIIPEYLLKSVSELTDEEFAMIAPTVGMSFDELVGDNGIYNGYPEYFPYPDTYKIVVDLKYQVVMVYRKDADGNFTIPVRYMKCSSGANGSESPTGTFKMRDYRVRFALFRNTASYAQYWSLITGKIYFHSILYDKLDAATYTASSWNNLGKNVSHGCIRLTVPDARWIWYNIAPQTECQIKYGTSEDTETKLIKERLVLAKVPDERLKLKKGEIPHTDNWNIEDVPQEVPFVNGSQD